MRKGSEMWGNSAWRLRGDLANAYKYLVDGSELYGAIFHFSVVPSNRASGSGSKLKHRKLHMNMRKGFFTSTGH